MHTDHTILVPIDIHADFSPKLLERHLRAYFGQSARVYFIAVIPELCDVKPSGHGVLYPR